MKVFMIGGTGLIGSVAAREIINKGYYVTSLALPPIPKGLLIPKEMKLYLKDFSKLSDADLIELFKDCYGFIFAAGIDERVEGPSPIYDMFYKYNIEPLKRLLPLAKKAGVKHSIILGSYFTHFNKEWPELDLYNTHPYIRSRVDQEEIALSFSDEEMSVSVLELPYIFGIQPGRIPVWIILAEQILKMKFYTYYPKGGTTMITINQLGGLIANLLEKPNGALAIPVGYYNLTWKEMLAEYHKALNLNRKIKTVPEWLYRFGIKKVDNQNKKKGIESGLNLIELSKIMYREAFIDKKSIEEYDIPDDDILKAIYDSVKLSYEVIKGKKEMIGMVKE